MPLNDEQIKLMNQTTKEAAKKAYDDLAAKLGCDPKEYANRGRHKMNMIIYIQVFIRLAIVVAIIAIGIHFIIKYW